MKLTKEGKIAVCEMIKKINNMVVYESAQSEKYLEFEKCSDEDRYWYNNLQKLLLREYGLQNKLVLDLRVVQWSFQRLCDYHAKEIRQKYEDRITFQKEVV